MEFFNNKDNDTLKFKINSEGININNIEPRLLLMTKENKNILLVGRIENDTCKFDMPQLGLYEKGDKGKIKFEIISEEMYFPVWEDNFEINSKATIKIEEMVNEIQQKSKKPTISVESTSIDSKPVFEKKEDKKEDEVKKEDIKTNKTLSKLESIFDNQNVIIDEDIEDNEIEEKNENIKKEEPIMKFGSFNKK